MVVIRSRYSDRLSVKTENTAQSMTQQHFANEVNINSIIARYNKTGQLPLANSIGQYGDVSDVRDYKSALDLILRVDDDFDSLPAAIRRRFSDSPALLYEFLMDEKNYDEAVSLGLVESKPSVVEEPVVEEPVVEASKASKKATES